MILAFYNLQNLEAVPQMRTVMCAEWHFVDCVSACYLLIGVVIKYVEIVNAVFLLFVKAVVLLCVILFLWFQFLNILYSSLFKQSSCKDRLEFSWKKHFIVFLYVSPIIVHFRGDSLEILLLTHGVLGTWKLLFNLLVLYCFWGLVDFYLLQLWIIR